MILLCQEVSDVADYMGQRIIDEAYTYDYVISRRPDLQEGINRYLTSQGREDLISVNTL